VEEKGTESMEQERKEGKGKAENDTERNGSNRFSTDRAFPKLEHECPEQNA